MGAPPARAAFVGTPTATRKPGGRGDRLRAVAEVLPDAVRAGRVAGVSRLAEITGLDVVGYPSFNSVRPHAEGLIVTGGRGATPEAARVSALLEAVERFAAERHGRVGPVATRARLRGRSVDPASLVLDAESPWRAGRRLEWWPCRDLRTGDLVRAPAAAVLHPYPWEPFLFCSSSNGLAAGSSLPEATLHALHEVIERDAVAFGERHREGDLLDLGSVDDPECRDLLGRFARAGVEVRVRVLRSDLRLPTMYAIADDRERFDPLLINGGMSFSLDPTLALRRALSEAAASRATVLSGARDDLDQHGVKRRIGYERLKAAQPWWFSDAGRRVPLRALPDRSTDSLTGDIRLLCGRLAARGLRRVLAADLTVGALPFAVARVVVPGAEFTAHEQRRFGPRLLRRAEGRR